MKKFLAILLMATLLVTPVLSEEAVEVAAEVDAEAPVEAADALVEVDTEAAVEAAEAPLEVAPNAVVEATPETAEEIVLEAALEAAPEAVSEAPAVAMEEAPAAAAIAGNAATPTKTVKNNSTVKLNKGKKAQLVVSGKTIKSCASSKKSVATVSKKGLVTAKAAGTAKVTITLTNKKKITVTVKVTDPTKPTGISLSKSGTVKLPLKQKLTLTATLKPSTAKGKITWSTSNKKVATVKNGVVTPKKKGTVTITAKCGKYKKTIKVKVVAASTEPTYTVASDTTPEPVVTVAPTQKPTTAPTQAPTTAPTAAPTPAPTEHVHQWKDVTKTVEHPAETHEETYTVPAVTHVVHHDAVTHEEQKWVVDKAAWTQTTENRLVGVCGGCGRYFFSFADYKTHSLTIHKLRKAEDWDGVYAETAGGLTNSGKFTPDRTGGGCGSYGSMYADIPLDTPIQHPEEGHYETVTVTDTEAWDETVVDQPERQETRTVVDKEAWTETVVTGQQCETCGETR